MVFMIQPPAETEPYHVYAGLQVDILLQAFVPEDSADVQQQEKENMLDIFHNLFNKFMLVKSI